MSRYTDLSPLALTLFAAIGKHSSQRPISLGDVLRRAGDKHADAGNAIQSLIDARLITTMTHIVNGKANVVYWPTGLKPIKAPNMEQISMASEPKNAHLARLVLLHGPIAGPTLAEKAREGGANIPAKNVAGLLETRLKHGDIIAKKIGGVTMYMTPNQAADMDGADATADGERDKQIGAHVMSAPAETDSDKDDEAMPEPDAALLASANRMLTEKVETIEQNLEKQRTLLAAKTERIVDLENQLTRANGKYADAMDIYFRLSQTLKVSNVAELPAALDELIHAQSTRAMQSQETGRLALLLIDSADLTEVEELDANCDPRIAQAAAMARIDQGHAARAVVVRIIGEAVRQVEWKAAA